MSVRKAGGRSGGAGGARGAGGGPAKVSGTSGASGPAGVSGKSGAGAVSGTAGASAASGAANVQKLDAVTTQALQLVKQAKAQNMSQEEFTQKFVKLVLKERLKLKKTAEKLTKRIAESVEGDPRLHATLERLLNSED